MPQSRNCKHSHGITLPVQLYITFSQTIIYLFIPTIVVTCFCHIVNIWGIQFKSEEIERLLKYLMTHDDDDDVIDQKYFRPNFLIHTRSGLSLSNPDHLSECFQKFKVHFVAIISSFHCYLLLLPTTPVSLPKIFDPFWISRHFSRAQIRQTKIIVIIVI